MRVGAGRDPSQAGRVHYARWLYHAKTFAASAMTALFDALLDDVLLLGSPSRIREGIERLAEAGVEISAARRPRRSRRTDRAPARL